MALGDLFKKNYTSAKYIEVHKDENADQTKFNKGDALEDLCPSIPDNLIKRCVACGENIYDGEDYKNLNCCPSCGFHYRVSARRRLEMIADKGTFIETNESLRSLNPLGYPGYEEKIKTNQEKSGESEGVITGICKIKDNKSVICIMDSTFMMGSMGSVVGEKITRSIELASEKKLPLIIFTASGGARMQEGIVSLMQMAKTSGALKRFSDCGGLYITVLTDPTTGGVTASFAMLGDIIIAEPGATVGFAGKRVIEQTIRQELPKGFQSAEFLLEHGFVDKIVPRLELKNILSDLIYLHREVI